MRLIGHLDAEGRARAFGDFLYLQGIDNQVEGEPDGHWAVWVMAEEHLDAARALLLEFQRDPADPRYAQAGREARARRHREEEANAAAQKRFFDATRLFPETTRPPLGPLTLLLIVTCVVVFLMQMTESLGPWVRSVLRLSHPLLDGLPEVRRGQVWRLFTPILMHGGMLHLLFNMLWLKDLGSLIERRQGTLTLGVLALALALISNLTQYIVAGPNFLGMSGVVYGLFGYIWVRGHTDPASGLFIDQTTVMLMLIWFLLCFTGWVGPIANGAHAGGLFAGAAWGFLSGRFSPPRFRGS